MSAIRTVACPSCKNAAEFSPNNPFRPFCSERCKLIDLGLWADEQFTIASPIDSDTLSDVNLDGLN